MGRSSKRDKILQQILDILRDNNASLDFEKLSGKTVDEVIEEVHEKDPEAYEVISEKMPQAVVPNSKFVNMLTNKDVIGKEIEVVVSKATAKKQQIDTCCITFQDEGVSFTCNFTEYEMQVHNAVVAMFKNSITRFTPAMVYHVMTGHNAANVSTSTLKKIKNSLRRLMGAFCTLRNSQAIKDSDRFFEGNVLSLYHFHDKYKNGVKEGEVDVYMINAAPILYMYSSAKKQIVSYPLKLLAIPDKTGKRYVDTEERIVLKNQLLKHICIMERNPQFSKNIKLDMIYDLYAPAETRTKDDEQAARDYARDALNYWAKKGRIAGYKTIKKGQKITAFQILF